MDADKLMVVAHPDDEVLWGGMNLLLDPGWLVVCATNAGNPVRAREFYRTMSLSNVAKWVMYDVKDKYTEKEAVADALFDGSAFDAALKELARRPWKLVLTHNDAGEYGHEHHRKVHRMVAGYFPAAKFFKSGPRLPDTLLRIKRELMMFYAETQAICRKVYDDKGATLKKTEHDHYFHETLYVSPRHEVPKLIHQIWFGPPLDKKSVRYNLMENLKTTAEANGFAYKLWTNADLNSQTLPLTWDSIQAAMEMGDSTGQSRFAQVADLARYELLHRFGGVYMDSLFEIGKAFCDEIVKHRASDIIVANEDPCGLECKGTNGKGYMSNGFFACIPGCVVLKRLLHPETQKYIDFENVRINQETGPYFFRLGIKAHDSVHVIPTEKIYPFMVNDSEYRPAQPNKCVGADNAVVRDCLATKYKNSLAVYHSGFGGSWSW